MTLKEELLSMVREQPGISRSSLCNVFGLTDYRLNRVFRQIERELSGNTIVHHPTRGVWIVEMDPDRCLGMDWLGREAGGYRQCSHAPRFRDGCCYEHSQCENPEIVAFSRKLSYLVGPAEPSAHNLCQLNLAQVEGLSDTLDAISPMTRKDAVSKIKYQQILSAALAMLRWRLQQRRANTDNWIPPEFRERHGRSSVNPFEYSLKKHFAILEVPTDAEKEEVVKAWKRLCRRFHPDVDGGDEDRMKQINLAKERIFRIRRWD